MLGVLTTNQRRKNMNDDYSYEGKLAALRHAMHEGGLGAFEKSPY